MISYLESLKVSDLKLICKNSGIIGVSKMKKKDLIDVMKDCDLKGLPDSSIINLSDIVPPTIIEEEIVPVVPVVPVVPASSKISCCHGSDDPLCSICEATDPIILHIPIKPDSLKVNLHKWNEMYKKGKNILVNGNAHTHK